VVCYPAGKLLSQAHFIWFVGEVRKGMFSDIRRKCNVVFGLLRRPAHLASIPVRKCWICLPLFWRSGFLRAQMTETWRSYLWAVSTIFLHNWRRYFSVKPPQQHQGLRKCHCSENRGFLLALISQPASSPDTKNAVRNIIYKQTFLLVISDLFRMLFQPWHQEMQVFWCGRCSFSPLYANSRHRYRKQNVAVGKIG
jgi:hypothetical protein